MHPSIKHLAELQAVDLYLKDLQAQLASFPKRKAEIESRVEAARKQFAAARDALTNSLKDRKKYELDVEQWKEKARKYKDQVYEVKTNEAYKALQHEIQTAETEIAKAEDRLLERMVAGEEFEREIKATEQTLKEAEAAARTGLAAIAAEQAAVEKEIEARSAERQKAVAAVPEELLDLYHRIAKRHDGIALAEIHGETCALCGMRIRPHVIQELRRGDCQEIFHCPTCTRILYYIEQPVAQASES